MSEIKILSRNPADWVRQTKIELHPIHRNLRKDRNHFETVREYQRALNAQKLERVMAKPFVAALEGIFRLLYTRFVYKYLFKKSTTVFYFSRPHGWSISNVPSPK